jgi:hypothetical protein
VGAVGKKIRLLNPKNISVGICVVGYFFGVKTMALDILHNVIIGQPVRLDACISKGKGCAKRTYNATLCKHSFHRFAYWHKRNGGGGWSEVSFCFVFLDWDSSLQPQERGLQCAVVRWQKTTQKV